VPRDDRPRDLKGRRGAIPFADGGVRPPVAAGTSSKRNRSLLETPCGAAFSAPSPLGDVGSFVSTQAT
jgi:hypothetical protein